MLIIIAQSLIMKYKKCKRFNIPGHIHALTFSCHKMAPLLLNRTVCEFLIDSIRDAKNKHKFDLLAYVFMPDHVHLIIWPRYNNYCISRILLSIKQPVARKAIDYAKHQNQDYLKLMATNQIARPYHFWQKGGGFDKNICNSDGLIRMIKYIHNNPVRRGLIGMAEDWHWSSAWEWTGLSMEAGIVNIESFVFGGTSPNQI